MKMTIELSKRGLPCMWEQGGAYSNTGDGVIIGDVFGNPKKAIYVKRKGGIELWRTCINSFAQR